MYSFRYDYSEGCHPAILQALQKTNLEQQPGYGNDEYSVEAKRILKNLTGYQSAAIHFISGGTQTNLIVIQAVLQSFEAVISADTGHIYVNEAGAVESTGRKIIAVKNTEGKLTPQDIQQVVDAHDHYPHVVKPKLVYISNATEIGTIYTKQELTAISKCCKKNNLYLFMDGARLGAALASVYNDVTLKDIARLTDVFYLGGTKNGALLGEAVVINNKELQTDFEFHLKQRGALLAKGRILGIQFLTLLQDDLFVQNARYANKYAENIAAAAKKEGYVFLTPPQTNQLFIILPDTQIKKLQKKYEFYIWKKIDNKHAAIRIVTSWATEMQIVEALINDLKKE